MTMCLDMRVACAILLVWCLQLRYVHCAQPKLRLNSTKHDILKALYDSSGGSKGKWNYAEIESCLTSNNNSHLISRVEFC